MQNGARSPTILMRIPFFSRRKRPVAPARAEEQLPPEVVRRIERWLSAEDAFPDESTIHAIRMERRDGLRRALDVLRVRATVRIVGPGSMGHEINGGVRDVSSEGLSLLLDQPVPPDRQLRVVIQPTPEPGETWQQKPITVRCTTCWCRHDAVAGGYVVGCRVGVEWTNSLFDLMLPSDGNRRVA